MTAQAFPTHRVPESRLKPHDLDRLHRVFRDTLQLDAGVDLAALRYGDHQSWDSVGHMALVAAIESEFDVMFETDDVLAMSTVATAVAILERLDASLGS